MESTTEVLKEEIQPDSQTMDDANHNGDSQKPVISEADSTETAKAAIIKEEAHQVIYFI